MVLGLGHSRGNGIGLFHPFLSRHWWILCRIGHRSCRPGWHLVEFFWGFLLWDHFLHGDEFLDRNMLLLDHGLQFFNPLLLNF